MVAFALGSLVVLNQNLTTRSPSIGTLNHPPSNGWHKSRFPLCCLLLRATVLWTIQTWFSSSPADTPFLIAALDAPSDSHDLIRLWFWECSQVLSGSSRYCASTSRPVPHRRRDSPSYSGWKRETLMYQLPDVVWCHWLPWWSKSPWTLHSHYKCFEPLVSQWWLVLSTWLFFDLFSHLSM